MLSEKDLLSSDDICSLFGWSQRTLYNRISMGEPMPPSIKVGGKRFFRRAALVAWLEARETETEIKL